MYKVDNQKIGNHLDELIKSKGYPSARQFAIAYLKCREDNNEPSGQEIQNMQNRLSQIINGNYGIQLEDFPIFSKLLGVSAEEILSGGTDFAPAPGRITNYRIAHSDATEEWETYVNRDDKPFLNPDEFNKTIIDYALEGGNYQFLKYLMDKGYIWFVGDNRDEYCLGFGAGTSVERRNFSNLDLLDIRMKENDDLRFKMIALAMDNRDFDMLETLKAREIPELYMLNIHLFRIKELSYTENVKQMIKKIAGSDNVVLSYFFSEFEIKPTKYCNALGGKFFFPYAGNVLECMIEKDRIQSSRRFLEKAIDHNRAVWNQIQNCMNKAREYYKKLYEKSLPIFDDTIEKSIISDYYYNAEAGNLVSYAALVPDLPDNRVISNVIHVDAQIE